MTFSPTRLSRFLSRQGTLLVAAYRPEEIHTNEALKRSLGECKADAACEVLRLAPFQEDEVGKLLSLRFPELGEDALARWQGLLLKQTGGNVFYVTQLLEELDPGEDNPTSVSISSHIRSLLMKRLGSFSKSATQVLDGLAVFGRPCSLFQLQQASACGEEEVVQAIELGLQWGLLESIESTEDIAYRFCHEITRQVILEALSRVRLQLLHGRVAGALEQTGGVPAQIAYHLQKAGQKKRALMFAKQAAIEAIGCYAYQEAITHFRHCVEWSVPSKERLFFLRRLGELLQWVGDWEQAESTLKRAFEEGKRFGISSELVDCMFSMAKLMSEKGDIKQALFWLERVRDVCKKQKDLDGAARALGQIGRMYRIQGQLESAQKAYEEKVLLAQQMSDNRGLCEAYSGLSVLFLEQGAMDKALECFEKTLGIAVSEEEQLFQEEKQAFLEEGDGQFTISRMMGHAGFLSNEQDNYSEALNYFEQQLAFSDVLGDLTGVRRGLEQLIALYSLVGDIHRAFSFLQRHFALASQQFSFPGLSKTVGYMGDLYRYQGDFTNARRCYEYKLSMALDLDEKRGIAVSLGKLGETLARQDEQELAERLFSLAIERSRAGGFFTDLSKFLHQKALLYFGQEMWEDALTSSREATELAQQTQVQKVLFEGKCLQLEISVYRETQKKAQVTTGKQAIQELLEMLNRHQQEEECAYLHYTLVTLCNLVGATEDASVHKEKAISLYQKLYQQLPHLLYFQRHAALGAAPLHKTAALPEPPAQIQHFYHTLEKLLLRVEKVC